jgi:large subunit ribosomal protein L31
MAKSTELQYFPAATVNCSNCNSVYTMGMTVEKQTVEICGNCHPFYTGQETLIDTAGRIEKFTARQNLATAAADKKSKFKARKTKQSLADLAEEDAKAAEEVKPAKNVKKVRPVEAPVAEVAAEEVPAEVVEAPVEAMEVEMAPEVETVVDGDVAVDAPEVADEAKGE